MGDHVSEYPIEVVFPFGVTDTPPGSDHESVFPFGHHFKWDDSVPPDPVLYYPFESDYGDLMEVLDLDSGDSFSFETGKEGNCITAGTSKTRHRTTNLVSVCDLDTSVLSCWLKRPSSSGGQFILGAYYSGSVVYASYFQPTTLLPEDVLWHHVLLYTVSGSCYAVVDGGEAQACSGVIDDTSINCPVVIITGSIDELAFIDIGEAVTEELAEALAVMLYNDGDGLFYRPNSWSPG